MEPRLNLLGPVPASFQRTGLQAKTHPIIAAHFLFPLTSCLNHVARNRDGCWIQMRSWNNRPKAIVSDCTLGRKHRWLAPVFAYVNGCSAPEFRRCVS
jgi:hypothetical protein